MADVPLGEESETYEVDILDGDDVKRTIAASTPTVLYTSAQQIADFGGVQSAVSVRVYQYERRLRPGLSARRRDLAFLIWIVLSSTSWPPSEAAIQGNTV